LKGEGYQMASGAERKGDALSVEEKRKERKGEPPISFKGSKESRLVMSRRRKEVGRFQEGGGKRGKEHLYT